jgi:hypothetical protein
MATPDVTKIQIGHGDIWVGGTAPAGGSDLTDPNAGTPSALNTAASLFTAPSSGGTYVGFTNGPANLAYRPTYYMVETEQAFAEVAVVPTGEEASLTFNAQEVTYLNLKNAYGQATTRVTVGPPASNAVFVGSKPTVSQQLAVLISRKRSGVGYFILSLYQSYSFAGATTNFERRAETRIPTELRCLADLTRPVGDQLFQLVEYPANPA